MKGFMALLLIALSLNGEAAIKEIFLPTLDCQGHLFQDVSVSFDDEKSNHKEITVSLICQKLKAKLVRKTVVSELSRFVSDHMAPKQVDKLAPRANDFFKLLTFKPNILNKKKFTFTEQTLEEIIQAIKNPRYMRLRTFSPSADNMHVMAYQQGGAAYLNSFKTERSACSMINTLVHEYMHFLGYGHGDNSPEGKEDSVPYFFGERAQELCEAGVI